MKAMNIDIIIGGFLAYTVGNKSMKHSCYSCLGIASNICTVTSIQGNEVCSHLHR